MGHGIISGNYTTHVVSVLETQAYSLHDECYIRIDIFLLLRSDMTRKIPSMSESVSRVPIQERRHTVNFRVPSVEFKCRISPFLFCS